MIQEHYLGATFYRNNLCQSKISREGSIGQDGQAFSDRVRCGSLYSYAFSFFVYLGRSVGGRAGAACQQTMHGTNETGPLPLCTFSVMGLSMCSSIFSESSPLRSKSGIINELSGFPNSVPTVRCSVTSSNWHGHTGHAYYLCLGETRQRYCAYGV